MRRISSSFYQFRGFTLAVGEIDYDVKQNVAGLFDDIDLFAYCRITATGDIGIKINKTDADEIEQTRSENGYLIFGVNQWLPIYPIRNLYLSNRWPVDLTVEILLGDANRAINLPNG